MNIEIKRNIIDEEQNTESNYPFTIKPNFSTLGSVIEKSTQAPVITFVPDDSIRDHLGFNKNTIPIHEENNLSPKGPFILHLLSPDNIFLECIIAQGMIFKSKKIWNNS